MEQQQPQDHPRRRATDYTPLTQLVEMLNIAEMALEAAIKDASIIGTFEDPQRRRITTQINDLTQALYVLRQGIDK